MDREFSFVSWLFQSLVAWCAPLILLAILEGRLGIQDTPYAQIGSYIFLALTSGLLALLLSTLSSNFVPEGSSVWALPAILELFVLVWQLCTGEGIRSLFLTSGPGAGEEGRVIVLLTTPTWSCCWYAAAMYWRRRKQVGATLQS